MEIDASLWCWFLCEPWQQPLVGKSLLRSCLDDPNCCHRLLHHGAHAPPHLHWCDSTGRVGKELFGLGAENLWNRGWVYTISCGEVIPSHIAGPEAQGKPCKPISASDHRQLLLTFGPLPCEETGFSGLGCPSWTSRLCHAHVHSQEKQEGWRTKGQKEHQGNTSAQVMASMCSLKMQQLFCSLACMCSCLLPCWCSMCFHQHVLLVLVVLAWPVLFALGWLVVVALGWWHKWISASDGPGLTRMHCGSVAEKVVSASSDLLLHVEPPQMSLNLFLLNTATPHGPFWYNSNRHLMQHFFGTWSSRFYVVSEKK